MFPVFVPVSRRKAGYKCLTKSYLWQLFAGPSLQRESQTFSISRVVVQNFCQFTLFNLSVTENELFKTRKSYFLFVHFTLTQVKLKGTNNVPSCYDWQWRYQESCVCLHLHCVRVEGFGWLDSGENHLNVGATEVITATAVLVIETKGDGRR